MCGLWWKKAENWGFNGQLESHVRDCGETATRACMCFREGGGHRSCGSGGLVFWVVCSFFGVGPVFLPEVEFLLHFLLGR